MSGAGFILAINLFVAGLISAAFMMVAVFDRGRVAARWLAFAYAAGTGFFAIEAAIPMLANARLAVVAAAMSMLVGMAAFNVGLARKYDRKVPRLALCAILLVSVVVLYAIQDLPRQSPTRMFAYQIPFALMQLVGASIVLSARERRGLDNLLVGLLAASAVQFLSKPLLAGAFGGWGDRPQDYIGSTYALISQTMATVFALAVALLVLVILVRDVLADANARSETDTLSGLLNRRGFEAHAADRAVREAVRREAAGVAGDRRPRPLQVDQRQLRPRGGRCGHRRPSPASCRCDDGEHSVAGRIGGEEFAIVLPGTNLVAARLFAEGARSAFASLTGRRAAGRRKRFTASFGVAELAPAARALRDLMRACRQGALRSQEQGRDCVRVSLAAGRLRPLTRAG